MPNHAVEQIRNVALISHSGTGKTSMLESMLFLAGATKRRGNVDDGNSILDFEPEERERRVSISSAIAPLYWKDQRIQFLDTPGYFDFVGEVHAALRATDSAIVVAEAVSGVEVGTEMVWEYARDYGLPKIAFINKMDRENADFFKVLEQLRDNFSERIVPLQLPIGRETDFNGIVDVLNMTAYQFASDGAAEEIEIPDELREQSEEYHEEVMDAIVEGDDELLMMYLEGEELDGASLQRALRQAIIEGEVVPVLCGASALEAGMSTLLDFIAEYLPAPSDMPERKGWDPESEEEISRKASVDQPFSGIVFKTMADPYVGKLTVFRVNSGQIRSNSSIYNASQGEQEDIGQLFVPMGNQQESIDEAVAGDLVAVAKLQHTITSDTLCSVDDPILYPGIQFPEPVYSVAVEPEARGDEEKIGSGLARLAEEDPTFNVERNAETRQQVLFGMGDLHVAVITDRLKRKFGVSVRTFPPKIAYRETITDTATAHYRHKKQSGGRGQFGEVDLRVEPNPDDDFEFLNEIFGGAVPNQFIPAVEKGIRETLQEGPIAGYPVINVGVALYDGGYHPVDSSEMAFKTAGAMAFKQAFLDAKPVLLEPILEVEVRVPDTFMGDVIGDLNRKRGKIMGMEPEGGSQVIKAKVPASEMTRYAIDLRSITQGRGTYKADFSSYEPAPSHVMEKIIADAQEEAE